MLRHLSPRAGVAPFGVLAASMLFLAYGLFVDVRQARAATNEYDPFRVLSCIAACGGAYFGRTIWTLPTCIYCVGSLWPPTSSGCDPYTFAKVGSC